VGEYSSSLLLGCKTLVRGQRVKSFWTALLLSSGDSSSHLNQASAPPNVGIKLEQARASSQLAMAKSAKSWLSCVGRLVLGEATSRLLIACDGTCRAAVDLYHLFVVAVQPCCDQGGALKPSGVSV
jgi:hypothetical protein